MIVLSSLPPAGCAMLLRLQLGEHGHRSYEAVLVVQTVLRSRMNEVAVDWEFEHPTSPGHVAILTNQMLVYKHHRVISSIVTRSIKNVAKTPKLNRRINLGISSDLGITNPRFIFRF